MAGGKLNPAQSDKFIDYVIDETVLKDNARIVRFRNEPLDIDKIGVGKRVAVAKAEASDPGVRRGITIALMLGIAVLGAASGIALASALIVDKKTGRRWPARGVGN